MSLKDCLRIVKTLDPADRESFNAEFETLTKGGIPPEEAYAEAAEAVMESILGTRNELAAEIVKKEGYLETLTLEHLVNPLSYEPESRGAASDIAKMSTDDFDALLEEASPTPADTNPVPKEPETKPVKARAPAIFIGTRRGKKLRKESVKQLRTVAKETGITGYSKMDKETLATALEAWYDAQALAALPAPPDSAADTLKYAGYTRADSSIGFVVNSIGFAGHPLNDSTGAQVAVTGQKEADTSIGAWASHFGSTVKKKAPTFEGEKTPNGYHFQGTDEFARFVKAYTGKDLDTTRTTTGSPTELSYVSYRAEPKELETFERGDEIEIIPDMPGEPSVSGEIVGEITMAKDGPASSTLESYVVKYEDPESGETKKETFHPSFLRKRKPPSKKARAALKEAAKHGVKGADEALTGLTELFGGKGKFSSGFTFDEETYAKAKPHFKKALEEFVAAGKSLKEFLQYILENFGEGIKPYLRQFHQDVSNGNITVRGVNDVQSTTQEQVAAGEPRAEPTDQGDIEAAGVTDAEVSLETGERPAEEEGTPADRIGLPVDSPVDVGEQGDIDVLGDSGEFQAESGVTGREDTGRGAAAGTKGVSAETPGSRKAQADARSTASRLKLKPTTSTWVQSDPENVAATLPALFPEQLDDVVFAENRIYDNGARGVMFTNGTGTGKTFTGLGIIKRMVMQGKDNILIVVPGEKVAADWIKSGIILDLDITKLKGVKDAGNGVVITSYANISENDEIVKRDWDLVVHDEAHKLSENMAGNATNALNKSRALTGHPDGGIHYASSMERPLLDEMKGLRDQIEHFMAEAQLNPQDAGMFSDMAEKASDQLEVLNTQWREKSREHIQNRKELWAANTTKRLDLTATPFAYEKSVDHAEGFLFEYDRSIDQESRGYNQPSARGSFFVEHFGYRMRYGKLTEPEAGVDRGLMQRQFNTWLKDHGALRGRVLTVDHDYSREFVAIDDLVGKKIDDGWDTIRQRGSDKENPNQKGYDLMEKQLRKQFNYHARVRMLEAIKARFAVKRARQHMALGRKVVFFHSRIKGGTMNPFHIFASGAAMADSDIAPTDEDAAMYQAAANEFVNERHDLMTLDINTVRPLDLFAEEFGDELTLYNGTITNKAKRENPDRFNSDTDEIQVIAVQDEGGKEGISLHDATGVNQRVLINLGLPVRPTQAIQIEGRIYRVGQMSNAIFEYFNTGTNFERMTFAEKISERASTAENLAMGEQARTIKDSFIDAYEDPSFLDPSDAQGVGGKETDQAIWGEISEFDRAKTHYFGTLKTKGRRDQRAGVDYFATPEPLGMKMVEWAGIKPNESVLEPSAGHGAIGRYFPELANSTYVEPSSELISRLALRAPGNHRQMNFEDLDVGGNKYSAIVMNPPFGSGGSTAMAHLHKAMHHLKNGGRIVALIPRGPAADKKFDNMFYGKEGELESVRERLKEKRKTGGSVADETRRIEDLTKYHMRANIGLPPITFTRAGTAISARVVVIDKIMNDDAVPVNQQPRDIHADTINELFDMIQDFTVPDRTERSQEPSDYLAKEGLIVSADEDNGVWRILGKTFEHRTLIRRALGNTVDYRGGTWVASEDPTEALYKEMTAPLKEKEVAPTAKPVWVKQDYQEFKSTDASINKILNPVTVGIVEKNYGWLSGTINADLGGGMHDNTVEYMKNIGIEHVVYDPFNRSDEYNAESVEKIRDGKADTVTINNTLNVVKEPELRQQLLMEAENALKPGGSLYIQIYEGDGSGVGRHTKGDIWQENRKATDFLAEIKKVFPNAEVKYGLISAQKFITAVKPDIASAAAALFSGRSGQLPNAPNAQFALAETTHAKKGTALFVASFGKRESREEYLRVLQIAKEHGGYHSSYKAKGAIPGFQFESALSRAAFLGKAGRKPQALIDRRTGGSTPAQVRKYLTVPLKRISSRVRIEIVAKASDIPTLHDLAQDAKGWYIDGKVYLVAENIRNQGDAITAFTHETVGHLGLEGTLGRKKTNELVGDIVNMKVEEMLSPGTHPELAKILGILRQYYVDKKGEYTLNPHDEALEVIAHIAESKPRVGMFVEIYNKILNWLRQQLVKWGIADPDMAKIEDALVRAVDFVKNPPSYYTGEGMTGVAAMRSSPKLRVAGIGKDDKLYIGEPGAIHMKLLDQYGPEINKRVGKEGDTFKELGFADSEGNFLTREEALLVVQKTVPGFEPWDTGNKLDALDYKTRADPLHGLDSRDLAHADRVLESNERWDNIVQDSKKPLASRKPDEQEPSEHEQEAFRKLGLGGKKTLWQKINNMRLKIVVETLDAMAGRGYEGLFDGLIEIKRREIESGVGIGVNDYENSAYVSARLATGVADMMTHVLHYGALQWQAGVAARVENTRGLLDIFNDLGIDKLNDWLLWMGAHRAKELMKEGRERNLTEDEIAAGIAKGEGGNKELFNRIKNEYAFMNKMMLDFSETAGLIDSVKRAEWESDWYVPFYRMSEGEIEGPRIKRGLSHQSAGIRRLFGADIPTNDLLENIMANWLKLIDSGVKNHALRLMIDNFEETDYITSETMRFTKALVPKSEIRKRIVADRAFAKQVAEYMGMDETANNMEIINEVNQIPSAGFEQLWALTAPKDPDIVRVKRNGKNEYWRVHIPGLLRAIGHINEKGISNSLGMRSARWFKRLLTTGVTASPDFMLRNFIRDAAHSWAINPDNLWFGVDAFKGLKKALDEDPLYRAAMASGASFQGGYVHATDPAASAQILRRELEKAGLTQKAIQGHFNSIINSPSKLKSVLTQGWQHYRTVGDKIENANRLATLDAAIKAGKPMAQALFESKDLMDYSRRGNFAMLIAFTDMMPFLNARMQGIDKLGRAAKQDPKIIARKAVMIGTFSVILAMMNDDDERYKELPDWEKDAYWHFWIDLDSPTDGHWRIPKPFELGVIAGTLPERGYRAWVSKSQPSEKVLWSLQHGLMETMNINWGIPQFALPVVEVTRNRSFYFDQPIESISDEGVVPKERYNAFTSNTAIALSDNALAEWMGMSPKQMQHLWNGYTGTMGAYALKLGDMIVRGVSDQPSREAIMPHDVPIMRSVYQGDRKKGTQWATDFYDRLQEVREIHKTMNRYLDQGKRQKARDFRLDNKDKLKYRRMLENRGKIFGQLRDKRDQILRNEDLSRSEKYQKSQDVQARINQIAKQIESQTRAAFSE